MLVLAALWLHALRKYARPIVWGTMLLSLVLLLYMGIRPAIAGEDIQPAPLVMAVVMVTIIVWKRKASTIQKGCGAS